MNTLDDVNISDIQSKLYDKLKPSGWGDKLKTFIMSDDFNKILENLLIEAKEGKRFTPSVKYLFRAFEECPYDKLNVVMIGQDPYPYPNVADGIAFSCSFNDRPEASLRYIFQEVQDTVYQLPYVRNTDLARWSNQGILIINSAFTTTIGKVGQHYDMWKPFLAFLFDILTFQKPDLVYVFMGKKAQEWSDSIPDSNFKFLTTHPASAAHRDLQSWDSGDVFNKINQALVKLNQEPIIW
jgi:uracil-DNA glycosylase